MKGRPTKLTPELQEKIVRVIRAGNYIKTACLACGITQMTYERWMKRGSESKRGIFVDFVEAIKKAEAEAEVANLKIVEVASCRNWQAAAWFLERKYPDRWGRKQLELAGVADKPLKVEIVIVRSSGADNSS